jgi:hypothetical protein
MRGTGQFDKEGSQSRDIASLSERDATRGSPRSLAAQRRLARDDNEVLDTFFTGNENSGSG